MNEILRELELDGTESSAEERGILISELISKFEEFRKCRHRSFQIPEIFSACPQRHKLMHPFYFTQSSISPRLQVRIYSIFQVLKQHDDSLAKYTNQLNECQSIHRLYNEIYEADHKPHSIE